MKVMKLWELMFWNGLSWEEESLVISKVRMTVIILDTLQSGTFCWCLCLLIDCRGI